MRLRPLVVRALARHQRPRPGRLLAALYGARTTLLASLACVALALAIGIPVGLAAGWFEGSGRHRGHARLRRVPRLPADAAPDHADRDARPGARSRRDRDRAVVGSRGTRCDPARRGTDGEARAVRRGRARHGSFIRCGWLSATCSRIRSPRSRSRSTNDLGNVIQWAVALSFIGLGAAGAHARMGARARRFVGLVPLLLVDRGVSGSRHRDHRAGAQPGGERGCATRSTPSGGAAEATRSRRSTARYPASADRSLPVATGASSLPRNCNEGRARRSHLCRSQVSTPCIAVLLGVALTVRASAAPPCPAIRSTGAGDVPRTVLTWDELTATAAPVAPIDDAAFALPPARRCRATTSPGALTLAEPEKSGTFRVLPRRPRPHAGGRSRPHAPAGR